MEGHSLWFLLVYPINSYLAHTPDSNVQQNMLSPNQKITSVTNITLNFLPIIPFPPTNLFIFMWYY
jgi:hypothetical protein